MISESHNPSGGTLSGVGAPDVCQYPRAYVAAVCTCGPPAFALPHSRVLLGTDILNPVVFLS